MKANLWAPWSAEYPDDPTGRIRDALGNRVGAFYGRGGEISPQGRVMIAAPELLAEAEKPCSNCGCMLASAPRRSPACGSSANGRGSMPPSPKPRAKPPRGSDMPYIGEVVAARGLSANTGRFAVLPYIGLRPEARPLEDYRQVAEQVRAAIAKAKEG